MGPDYGAFAQPAIEDAFATAGLMGVAAIFMIIWLVLLIFALILSVVSYVFSSLGSYTIAKRRGIKNPWLAWIPVGSSWIIGSISDQYQYVAKGKITNRRKILLGVQIGTLAVNLVLQFFNVLNTLTMGMDETVGTIFMLIMLLVALVMMAVAIANTVFLYMAYYDLFRSCNPKNATLFLVLSIVVTYALPILLFICRNKDLGMPPKKSEEAEVVDAPVVEAEILDAPED